MYPVNGELSGAEKAFLVCDVNKRTKIFAAHTYIALGSNVVQT